MEAARQQQQIEAEIASNEPLLRKGTLRASIWHYVDNIKMEGYAGSTSKIAGSQELGTGRIPPRSFLAEAAMHKEHKVS